MFGAQALGHRRFGRNIAFSWPVGTSVPRGAATVKALQRRVLLGARSNDRGLENCHCGAGCPGYVYRGTDGRHIQHEQQRPLVRRRKAVLRFGHPVLGLAACRVLPLPCRSQAVRTAEIDRPVRLTPRQVVDCTSPNTVHSVHSVHALYMQAQTDRNWVDRSACTQRVHL
jgi:hypothetical protein